MIQSERKDGGPAFVPPTWERKWENVLDRRFDRSDVRVNFGRAKLPKGYAVWWLDGYEMYYWHRDADDHLEGPYCDRWRARRDAIADALLKARSEKEE